METSLSLPYSADYLFFFLWMFAGSFFSDAGSYMKWQMAPGYVLCVPQQSIFHGSWLFNICKIELRFQNWLLDLDSLTKPEWIMTWRARHLGVFMWLKSREDSLKWCWLYFRWGKWDITRLSWFNSCKELMWTDLDIKDNELSVSSCFHLSLKRSKVGAPLDGQVIGAHALSGSVGFFIWWGSGGWGSLELPHSWSVLVLRSWRSACMVEVCSASGTCVRQRCLLVSTCLPG